MRNRRAARADTGGWGSGTWGRAETRGLQDSGAETATGCRSAGLKGGAARPVLSCPGQAIQALDLDPLLPNQPGSDPLPLPLPLPLPRPPPPPAPRPVPARVIVQSTTASLLPHGTGSSKRYRDALCWGGRSTTTPRGQRGRISGHFSSQVDRDSRAEVAGPAVLGGRVGSRNLHSGACRGDAPNSSSYCVGSP